MVSWFGIFDLFNPFAMEFTCSVTINQPIEKVTELFNNPDNLKEWQDGFVRMEHLIGEPGAVGSQTKLVYLIRGKEMELIETILVNELPFEFTGRYEAKTMVNTMKNTFTPLGDNQTQYDAYLQYTEFNGFIVKAMAFLMPGMFKKQTQKWLNQFKAFAEKQK